MSRPSMQPELTPKFCFNQTALRDFLRLSRSTIDDTITQHLNALNTPSRIPFDPTNLDTRSSQSRRRQIPSPTCQNFLHTILYPSWHSRSSLLTYCATVAASPDPSDPEALVRGIEDAAARQRIVDERLDPYSGRYFPREVRGERLADTVRMERGVEGVVRARTWRVVTDRCKGSEGSEGSEGWEEGFERWRKEYGDKDVGRGDEGQMQDRR